MSPLVKIRAERDQMSAIERRIADFILDNAHLLRDYSSQQVANALKISQSSVVKFSQKLGFKGYPDLKLSIGESVAHHRAIENRTGDDDTPRRDDPVAALAGDLSRRKLEAQAETLAINPGATIDAVAGALAGAAKVFVAGLGEDAIAAQAFALKLSLVGVHAVHHCDPVFLSTSLATAARGDVLLVFCEHGRQGAFAHAARELRERGGRIVSVTRHTANALRAHADAALVVSAHDERAAVEPLLYRAAFAHLVDVVFLALCERIGDAEARLAAAAERLQQLHDA